MSNLELNINIDDYWVFKHIYIVSHSVILIGFSKLYFWLLPIQEIPRVDRENILVLPMQRKGPDVDWYSLKVKCSSRDDASSSACHRLFSSNTLIPGSNLHFPFILVTFSPRQSS